MGLENYTTSIQIQIQIQFQLIMFSVQNKLRNVLFIPWKMTVEFFNSQPGLIDGNPWTSLGGYLSFWGEPTRFLQIRHRKAS